jgi:hypothetical protein
MRYYYSYIYNFLIIILLFYLSYYFVVLTMNYDNEIVCLYEKCPSDKIENYCWSIKNNTKIDNNHKLINDKNLKYTTIKNINDVQKYIIIKRLTDCIENTRSLCKDECKNYIHPSLGYEIDLLITAFKDFKKFKDTNYEELFNEKLNTK